MILAKHVITIYNKTAVITPPSPSPVETWIKTVVKYAQWEDSVDRNAGNDGHNVIDKHVSIIIPKTANTQGKRYVDYREFEITQDKTELWTMKPNETRIAYGETPDITSTFPMTNLLSKHKSCLVSGIEDLTNTQIMPHYEIIGV